jgi:hypothetical protein
MKMVVEEKHGDSLEPVKVPHSLHSFKRDEKDKEVRRSRIVALNLQFWNVGLQMKGLGSKLKVEVEVRIENITNVQIWWMGSCCRKDVSLSGAVSGITSV